MFNLAAALTLGIIIGTLAGPAIRIYATQLVTDVKAEFTKEKAVVEADLATAKADYDKLKTTTDTTIASLQAKVVLAEAKVSAVASLFPSSPEIQSIVKPVEAEVKS